MSSSEAQTEQKHKKLIQLAFKEFITHSENHRDDTQSRQSRVSKQILYANWRTYAQHSFGQLNAYKHDEYSVGQVYTIFTRWWKDHKKRKCVLKEVLEYRQAMHSEMKATFPGTHTKDLAIKHNEFIGQWFHRIQNRVLSPYMTTKAVTNKHKKKKKKKSGKAKSKRSIEHDDFNYAPNSKRRKLHEITISVSNPRISTAKKSPMHCMYLEKFAVLHGLMKINVSSVHVTTKRIHSLSFEISELTVVERRLLEAPKVNTATRALLIYQQHMNNEIQSLFVQKYPFLPKGYLFDTGSLRVRQHANIYNTCYVWNVEMELIPTHLQKEGCMSMTFQYHHRIGKFDKDNKTGITYACYFAKDVDEARINGTDMLISDAEVALQSVPKHIRGRQYSEFRLRRQIPMLISSINDPLHNAYNVMKATSKVEYNFRL
eukprot:99327_1